MTGQAIDVNKITANMSNKEVDFLLLEVAGESLTRSLHALVTERFNELQQTEGLTQEAIAKKMRLTPAQISRWLSSPTNMTMRSAARLLWAMGRKLDMRIP